MTEAVTPPNPDQTNSGRHGNPPQSIPDPTLMTIDALRREIAMLENLLNTRLEANEELTQERFHRIDEALSHFEEQRKEQKVDTRQAVDAALEAQKEATHKMERSMDDQLQSLTANFETSHRGIQLSINDLKDRMTQLESVKQGMTQQRDETRQITSGQIATIGLGIAIFMAVLALVSFMAGQGI